MKSFLNFAAASAAGLFAVCSPALANGFLGIPEPSSIALSGLGLAAAVYFLNKSKRK